MEFSVLLSELLLIVEIIVLIILAYHIWKLENYNKFLLQHLEKLEEHVTVLDNHLEKLDKHVDKLENHSSVMDYHLKTILDYSRIHQMNDEERKDFVKGIENFLEDRE